MEMKFTDKISWVDGLCPKKSFMLGVLFSCFLLQRAGGEKHCFATISLHPEKNKSYAVG
jgi:hypothetical protein